MNYSIREIARIVRAELRPLTECSVSVLLTDSRTLTFPGESLFFALKSGRNDGHKYIGALYRLGVRNFVVSAVPEELSERADVNFLVVRDPLTALQQLAAHHRRKFRIPVIGITGSNGKTIVKEWLYQLLQEDFAIARSPRSYNSQIGVPLSVWQLEKETSLGIFEAGISTTGEMERLAPMIQPKIGVLTNIGDAHQEGFRSLQEKCLEKLSLFQNADLLIYDGDNPLISDCVEKRCLGTREIAWSRTDKERPLYISKIERKERETTITYSYLHYISSVTIPFVEAGSIENAIHALAVLLYLGVPYETIAVRMKGLEPVAMRMEVKEGRNDALLINDSYNSDVHSLDIALDFLCSRDPSGKRKRTVILSDILQTGVLPTTLYRKIADLMVRKRIDRFIGIGPVINANAKLFKKIDASFYLNTVEFLNGEQIDAIAGENVLIKGSRDFHFETISDRLELKKPETILEVNLDAVVHNYNFYRQLLKPATKMICMVKAFGYGAGAYELARTLQEHGCNYLAVAVADEGVELRQAGITVPILVMNPEMGSLRTLLSYALEPEIYSFRLLQAFIREAERLGATHYPIHVKIDSGMHRLGFTSNDMPDLTALLQKEPSVACRSVFSHLAGSDDPQFDAFTREQIACFTACADRIQSVVPQHVERHILNTAGIFRFPEVQMDVVRLGIGLYGFSSSGLETGLRTVSTLKTTILQIKELEAGETVGYSRKGVLTRKSRIGVIPIGYADGFDRKLGNGNGLVVVNGRKARIVGNICMDLSMIDLTDIPCREGDPVEIFGERLPVEEIAEQLGTIPYEVIASVSSRVKRVYFRE